MKVDERGFEDAIEASLLAGGWLKSVPSHFDPVLGLDTAELFAFIGATQVQEWESLLARYPNDPDAAQRGFAKRLASEIDHRGTVDVLRHGVIDLGVTIRLAFFQPAHGLTPELEQLYQANRVSVTRQLAYEATSTKTIDLVLLVNGIPTATAELKNPLTNQDIEHAIAQYRNDRDPANVTLCRRALVHFAVDPDRVSMTTKLAGPATRFLPFNLGHDRGAGNPPNPNGHRTSYLWERVWARDAWMDLLARFIHVERPTQGSGASRRAAETVIFRASTSGTRCSPSKPTPGPTGQGRATWSSTRPARGSPTPSPGLPIACPRCTMPPIPRCSTRCWSSPTAWSWTASSRRPSTSSSTPGVWWSRSTRTPPSWPMPWPARRPGSLSPPCRSSPSPWTRWPPCPTAAMR